VGTHAPAVISMSCLVGRKSGHWRPSAPSSVPFRQLPARLGRVGLSIYCNGFTHEIEIDLEGLSYTGGIFSERPPRGTKERVVAWPFGYFTHANSPRSVIPPYKHR
jgi:hypothetical protein